LCSHGYWYVQPWLTTNILWDQYNDSTRKFIASLSIMIITLRLMGDWTLSDIIPLLKSSAEYQNRFWLLIYQCPKGGQTSLFCIHPLNGFKKTIKCAWTGLTYNRKIVYGILRCQMVRVYILSFFINFSQYLIIPTCWLGT